jgi:hypothetical protein
MSDQTGGGLARAEAALAAERTRSEHLERELLHRIAAGVPSVVDSIAKSAAESQPEVTRRLGSDGIRAMRAELAQKADRLAAEIRTGRITWPLEQPVRYGEARTRHLDAALFSFLHGRRMDDVVEVLRSHGFATRSDGERGPQDLLNPHALYDEPWLSALAEARTSLAAAQSGLRDMEQREADAAVRSIWDDSEE